MCDRSIKFFGQAGNIADSRAVRSLAAGRRLRGGNRVAPQKTRALK